ncbi:RagB/SusD family nutrient uptake outer membrane protein [Belliella marina]|uniref:RagB/SusD family nutrient uptake outer membrane protein n=1 Tax=Belliella marina TaxID=1644146 RepID=A0ABW4VP94_9BACT
MRSIKYLYRIAFVCLLVSAIQGCNDDFMDRFPLDQINDENFWRTAQDLELYNNSLYPIYINGFGYGWADGSVQPFGYNISSIAYGDIITDNAVPNSYSRVAANQYNGHITGSSGSGGWSWGNLRRINFFLENYQRGNVPDDVRNVYAGEVYFFKAMEYFDKVKTFGDVPWITEAFETNSEGLYAPRDSREIVMDSILLVLDKAIAYLPQKGVEKPGRLHKDAARFLKARVGLYEGTFRKYHSDLGLDGAKYLQACVDAAEQLMENGYSIYSTGDPDKDYNSLFAQFQYRNNPEVILYKEYSADLNLGSAFSRYYAQNQRHQHGATRDLVEEYLCADGLPISQSPLYQGKETLSDELTNRDLRLRQTVCDYGEYALASHVQGSNNSPLPNIPGLSGNKCPTGYRIAKWFIDSVSDWDLVTRGQQATPMFRYAELLLNYAEAKYELGQMDQGVLDNTINKIRARVDMPPLSIGNIPDDPSLEQKYAQYIGYVPAPVLREIRRERRVELAFENTRWDDLVRWKAGKFLEIPVEGFKFEQERYPTVVVDRDVFLSEEGYLRPYHQVLPEGRQWEDRQYLFPIPIEDLVLNPNLVQNPGWESN